MDARRHEPREMGHVHDEDRPDLVGDTPQGREIDDPGVGASATDQEAGALTARDFPDLVVVDPTRVFTNAVMRGPEQRAREIHGRAMREMTAVRQREAEQRVAGLGDRQIRGHVRLGARVRLHVGMLGLEERLRAIDGELLHFVDHLAPAVVALAGQAFGVFVRERRAHRFEHRDGHEVLARDQLEPVLLTLDFATDELVDRRIHLRERCPAVGHRSILATRRSWRPPSNGVSSHLWRISIPSSSLMNRDGNTSTFASLCLRDNSAISGLQTTAARTCGYRFATYPIPSPVPHVRTPRFAAPVLTASATGRAKSG